MHKANITNHHGSTHTHLLKSWPDSKTYLIFLDLFTLQAYIPISNMYWETLVVSNWCKRQKYYCLNENMLWMLFFVLLWTETLNQLLSRFQTSVCWEKAEDLLQMFWTYSISKHWGGLTMKQFLFLIHLKCKHQNSLKVYKIALTWQQQPFWDWSC